jgi:hypothetical protein
MTRSPSLLRGALAGTLFASALAAASPGPVVLREAGYLAIDGVYYVYGLPLEGGLRVPARLQPAASEGFAFAAEIGTTGCSLGPGAGALPPGLPRLRHAAATAALPTEGLALRGSLEVPATMRFVSCDGALVMLADSATGTATCGGAIAFPFRRGDCPGLDRADPGYVFFDAFE